jgi:hypothetical protein
MVLAISNGHLNIIKYLNESGIKYPENAMDIAIKNGHKNIIKQLISEHIELTQVHMAIAVENHNLDIIKFLHKNGLVVTWRHARYLKEYPDILKYIQQHLPLLDTCILFRQERFIRDDDGFLNIAEAYKDYKSWLSDNGYYSKVCISMNEFKSILELSLGIFNVGLKGWRGISLKQ